MKYYEEEETKDLIDSNITEGVPSGEIANMVGIIKYGIENKGNINRKKVEKLSLPERVSIESILNNFTQEDVEFIINYVECTYNDKEFRQDIEEIVKKLKEDN